MRGVDGKLDRDTKTLQFVTSGSTSPIGARRRFVCRGGMRLSLLEILARSWSGALLALLAVGVVAPPAARAGCAARYVTSRSTATGETAHVELLSLATPPGEPARPRPTPCSGAFCSGSPATPLPATPSIVSLDDGRWVIPPFPVFLVGPGVFSRSPVDLNPRPVNRTFSIFHPPRVPSPLI